MRDDVVAATGGSTSRRWQRSIATRPVTPSAIDVVGEAVVARFAERLALQHAFVLVAEGLPGGRRCYRGRDEASADWWLIIDPIDGTRGLMCRSAAPGC